MMVSSCDAVLCPVNGQGDGEGEDVRVVSSVDLAVERVFHNTSVCGNRREEGRHSGEGGEGLHTG